MRKFTMLLLGLCFVGLFAAKSQTTITGTVTSSEDGTALPGVSVSIKGTTTGTITNVDGVYSLALSSSGQTLVFSYVGMITKEVVTGSSTVVDVILEPEVIGVNEVVVTAFGISRDKKAVTYQTEKVSGEDLMKSKSTRAAEGLVGKVAGLQINVQDNGVNPQSQILLRGLRSVSGNNEALIVIDGSITSSDAFDDLNANDIESVNVLKGASAAALYGSNAANGAIIVTTKKGTKNQEFSIGVSHATTFESISYMPEFQTMYGNGWDGQYNEIENTNWGDRFDGSMRRIGPVFEDGTFQAVPYAPIKDNLKDFYNTGVTLQNTIYATGGDETGRFYLSIGNQDTKGIVPDDTYKRNTFRVNADKHLGKLKLSINSTYMFDETNVVGDQIGDQDRTFYWFILNTQSNIPLTSYSDWQNPNSYGFADNYYNAFYQNPYWAIGTNRDEDQTERLIGNVSASYDILDNISASIRGGVNTTSGSGKNWRAYQDYNPVLQPFHSTVSSFVEETDFQTTTFTGDALLQGDFSLTEDISLKAILGSALYSNKHRDDFIRANNLSIPDFYDISNGTGEKEVYIDQEQKRTIGFFGDFALDYQKMVYLNVTGRQDYTSTLAKGNNGYFYPAVGASVIVTEAIPALQNNRILSFAKITASNATVYNDLDPYRINERYSQNETSPLLPGFPFPFGDINGFFVSKTAVDENIQKEKINSTEIGANLAFLKGRFTFDATYFLTKTSDLITFTTPSAASASQSYLTNIGSLKGSGYEIAAGGTILEISDFKWDLNLNYYSYETVVKEIKEGLDEIAIEDYPGGYGTYAIKDMAFPQLKTVSYVRDPQGRVVVDANSGNPVIGEITPQGKTTPDYIVGLNSSMGYKGFTLAATFDLRGGYVYYSQGSDFMEFTGRSIESVSGDRKDFVWPNSVINVGSDDDPEYVQNTDVEITGGRMAFWKDHYNEIKENYVKDATAFKIRELSLNYTLPNNLISKTKYLKKVNVGLVTRNLLTVLPKGQSRFSDPEFRNTRDNRQANDDPNGIGIGGYITSPPTRTFGFSINVEF